ncbi:MAG TPA: MMPL family transporter [Candidatus Ventrisoma faecale]|nr:MMPL family transporter [Candidatus Ventrisoma faecale]
MMMRIAKFIVNKRKAFLALFALACVYSVISIPKVEVIEDVTEYLPKTTETRRGLDTMEEEFTTFGSGKILVANITYEQALRVAEEMEQIEGVSQVQFYDESDDAYEDEELEDYYKDASALFSITFTDEEDAEVTQRAIVKVRELVSGYSSYVYTTVDKDDAASLQKDMGVILAFASIVIVSVLLFTSLTYMEIVIFVLVFGVSALLNMGTNYLMGSISFVTNAVGTVLQLAMAIDYAIILFHRFMEEREHYEAEQAITVALSKAIPEISSSSLTTISGMVALMFMQFGIGMDLGRVMTKAIIFSLITVFLLMPALVMMFNKAIDRTRHRNFVPKINLWGKLMVKIRFVTIPLIVVGAVFGFIWSGKCQFVYDHSSINSPKKNEYLTSKDRISETFEMTNTMAVIVPKGDYQKEGQLLDALESMDIVESATGLANIEVGDDGKYILVDRLGPREFSSIADVDLDLARMLYRLYAVSREQYGALFRNVDDYKVSIIDMVDFIYEQKESGALDFGREQSEEIDDLHEAVTDARKQLEGENYSRMLFQLKGPAEGAETFANIDAVHRVVERYYESAMVVGDPTSNYDLSRSFEKDNVIISVLTALLVGIILLVTFQSAGLPFMLVFTIQSSIWFNFSVPYLTGDTMYFLSYLVVSSIQMGATIDYAIVITTRYVELRKTMDSLEKAVVESLNQAFPTIVTSGSILTCAGFLIGGITSNGVIASLGKTLGRGTLISIIMVMLFLPQLLMVFDKLIDKTALTRGERRRKDEA